MNHGSKLVLGALGLALAGLAIAPLDAGARARLVPLPGATPQALLLGSYTFVNAAGAVCPGPPVQQSLPFPGMPARLFQDPALPNNYASPLVLNPCIPGSAAFMHAAYPMVANGPPFAVARVIGGGGSAGLVGKLGRLGPTVVLPDTVEDSLAVSVNRGTAGQVTLTISGYAKHLNFGSAPRGVLSRLKVTVYPDTTSAKNETGAVASGELDFFDSDKNVFSGFFSAADFTLPTPIGNEGNDFQMSTVPNLQKVVTGVNANTATVAIEVDPDDGAPVLPTFTLNVSVVGGGSVQKSPNFPSYSAGTIVQLTAFPLAGAHFTAWSGDAGGSANPIQVTMNSNKNITATFSPGPVPNVGPIGMMLLCLILLGAGGWVSWRRSNPLG